MRPSGVAATKLGMKGELLLHGLEDYLKINFTLPKIDQIAIPDFGLRGEGFFIFINNSFFQLLNHEELFFIKNFSIGELG